MIAIIPAAGEGKRMSPLTDYIPKPLLPVAGEPVIDYAIREALECSAIDEVRVVYRHQALMDYIESNYSFSGKPVVLILQEKPEGMCQAINLATPKNERYAVLLPDVVHKMNTIQAMIDLKHTPLTAIATCPHGIVIPGAFRIEKPYWVVGRYVVDKPFTKAIPSFEASDFLIVSSDDVILLEDIYSWALREGFNGETHCKEKDE